MPRLEFCKNAKCARLTVQLEAEQVFISKAPPIIVEFDEVSEEYTHEMNQPIIKEFPFEITDVEYVSGQWYFNQFSRESDRADCPMPGTYPVLKAGDVLREEITDLYWHKQRLISHFDAPTYYSNNHGSCTYRVIATLFYKFSDRRGIIYKVDSKKLSYKIDCDDCCKDTEIMCDHHKYPGYKCYPIPPISSQLANNRYDISRFYK